MHDFRLRIHNKGKFLIFFRALKRKHPSEFMLFAWIYFSRYYYLSPLSQFTDRLSYLLSDDIFADRLINGISFHVVYIFKNQTLLKTLNDASSILGALKYGHEQWLISLTDLCRLVLNENNSDSVGDIEARYS